MTRPVRAAALLIAALCLAPMLRLPAAEARQGMEAIQSDPYIPVLGDPDGDVTVVEYFDYQCPYCRRMHPELMEAVEGDGNVRLILRDWPVFGEASEYASRMVLAAKHQGLYAEAHAAVMTFEGSFAIETVNAALEGAGVDLERAEADLDANREQIEAVFQRNDAQVRAIGLRGTPGLVVGGYLIPGMVEAGMLRDAIDAAREDQDADGQTE